MVLNFHDLDDINGMLENVLSYSAVAIRREAASFMIEDLNEEEIGLHVGTNGN